MGSKKNISTIKILFCKFLAHFYYLVRLVKLKKSSNLIYTKSLSTISHINSTDTMGGAAKIANELLKYQNTKGYTSKLLVGYKRGKDDNVFGINDKRTKLQELIFTGQKKLQWQDFFHFSSFGLQKNQIIAQSDIIHLHNIHGNYFSPFAINELSEYKHVVWTLHDMQAFTGHCAHSFDCDRWKIGCGNCPSLNTYPWIDFDTSAFIWKTKKRIYKKTNLTIVTPSNWLKQKVEKSILQHLPIKTIYNGIDTSVFYQKEKAQCRKNLGIPNDKIVVLFSAERGVKNQFKGGEFIEKIQNKYNDNIYLYINIGGGNEIIKESTMWTLPFIYDPNVLAHYYSAADIYLYPSLADNCPLVVMEAMACALPVLTFETGGIPEIVTHMNNGYVARYKDFDDLSFGFDLFCNNENIRAMFSSNSVIKVKQHFTKEKMNEQYIELYNSIIK